MASRSSILLIAVLFAIIAVLTINVQAAVRKPVYKPTIKTCFGIKSNDKKVCGGQGWCIKNEKCLCKRGFTGPQCMTAKPITKPAIRKPVYNPKTITCFGVKSTDKNVCSGQGYCSKNDQCICKKGFRGTRCQVVEKPVSKIVSNTQYYEYTCFGVKSTDKNVCSGRGYCFKNDVCSCKRGFSGKTCEKEDELFTCFGLKSTDSSVCGGRGRCVGTNECDCGMYATFIGGTCRATGMKRR